MQKQQNKHYIFGRNSIIEALNSGTVLEKIFLSSGVQGPAINKIQSLAKKSGTPLVKHDKKKFSRLEKDVVDDKSNSQGVIALKQMVKTLDLEELIEKAFEADENPVLVALDEITDPHNLGAIARSVECSGCQGLILPSRNTAPLSPAAINTSAGALEHLPVAKIGNLAQTIDYLKEKGFWILGTEMNAENFYTDKLYDRPIVLVIGSEGKGMRNIISKNCDIKVKIPMKGKIDSLNASVSAGIILFEILRQKNN